MELTAVLGKLEVLGSDAVRERNLRRGAAEKPQFGVQLGQIRKVAKEVGRNHSLALQLWVTGNIDARLLAILLLTPKQLSEAELDGNLHGSCPFPA